MEEFLHKLVFLHLDLVGKNIYYLCAYVKDISDTHITLIDKTKSKEEQISLSYRKSDVVEIKLSNRKAND